MSRLCSVCCIRFVSDLLPLKRYASHSWSFVIFISGSLQGLFLLTSGTERLSALGLLKSELSTLCDNGECS